MAKPVDKETRKRIAGFIEPYEVAKGKKFRLEDVDPDDTGGYGSEAKPQARALLQQEIGMLSELQERLYAQGR
jgi:hypothetical protein